MNTGLNDADESGGQDEVVFLLADNKKCCVHHSHNHNHIGWLQRTFVKTTEQGWAVLLLMNALSRVSKSQSLFHSLKNFDLVVKYL